MFVQIQREEHQRYFSKLICSKKTVIRTNGIQVSRHISLRMGEPSSVTQTTYFKQFRRKAQFIHSFSHRPELQSIQTHESYESAMQKTSWRSGGQNWVPINLGIWSQQTTRFSMKHKNPECITDMEWSCKTWRRNGFKVVYAQPISSRDATKSQKILNVQKKSWLGIMSERRNFASISSVWTARKLVGRSHGVLLLSPKCVRLASRWPDASWTSVQFIRDGLIPLGSWSTILSNIKIRRSSASVRHTSPPWNFNGIRFERGEWLGW